jgi:epoxyqueuosine reductase QueG
MVDVARVIGEALAGSGIGLVGSASIEAYDARAPRELQSSSLFRRARGVVVVASGGRALWTAFRAVHPAKPVRSEALHPLDAYVARALARANAALDSLGIAYRRFEPTLHAQPALDFRALGELTGLGSMGPFGMLIHEEHGPWWALRGAYLVESDVAAARSHRPPCAGCAAPCVGGRDFAHSSGENAAISHATAAVRARCIVGEASRYEDEQVAYHYGP